MPSTLKFTRFTQMQCRKCCNNRFDVYKLLMSNDIDHPPASWSIYCGDEKQCIILEWPYATSIDPETLFQVASSLTCNKRGNVIKEGMKEASITVQSAVKSIFCAMLCIFL